MLCLAPRQNQDFRLLLRVCQRSLIAIDGFGCPLLSEVVPLHAASPALLDALLAIAEQVRLRQQREKSQSLNPNTSRLEIQTPEDPAHLDDAYHRALVNVRVLVEQQSVADGQHDVLLAAIAGAVILVVLSMAGPDHDWQHHAEQIIHLIDCADLSLFGSSSLGRFLLTSAAHIDTPAGALGRSVPSTSAWSRWGIDKLARPADKLFSEFEITSGQPTSLTSLISRVGHCAESHRAHLAGTPQSHGYDAGQTTAEWHYVKTLIDFWKPPVLPADFPRHQQLALLTAWRTAIRAARLFHLRQDGFYSDLGLAITGISDEDYIATAHDITVSIRFLIDDFKLHKTTIANSMAWPLAVLGGECGSSSTRHLQNDVMQIIRDISGTFLMPHLGHLLFILQDLWDKQLLQSQNEEREAFSLESIAREHVFYTAVKSILCSFTRILPYTQRSIMVTIPETELENQAHPVMNWLDYLCTKSTKDKDIIFQNIDKPCPFPSDFPETAASYWIARHQFPLQNVRTTQDLPEKADLVIIGAGMVGAVSAYQISQAQPDLRVVLLEARGICSGATGRNGGHLSSHEAAGIRDLAKIIGAQDAIRVRQTFRKNRDMVLDVIEKYKAHDKVDLNLGGSLVCFGSPGERETLIADIEFCESHGWEPQGNIISPEQACEISGVSQEAAKHGAWYLKRGGTFYARKMVDLLITKASETMAHLNIQTHTPVTKVEFEATSELPYQVQTDRGNIRARSVLHATNAYARALVPELRGQDGVFGVRGNMIGIRSTEASARDVDPGFLHTYAIHYMLQRRRVTDDPEKPPIFLYGHGDAETIEEFDDSLVPVEVEPIKEAMYSFLEMSLPHHFPKIEAKKQVEYDWTGIMGFTKNGCSIVGRVSPERQGEFLCVGHNGEGMNRCFVLSTITAQAILAELNGTKFEAPDWIPRAYLRNM
ncbi:hypothetical protein FSARC_10575 [Fusarium sarcochroum]|uniref:FAD dependent oxidoreductase domain-containing protein n=1 Tax=Fusarium sarcochroum TaxID=1208366 RepID=A0A8H4TLM2_9HYPO|nr:hypothetical protein FSARC_10575 [Fusarium sarcochroum]